MPDKKKKREQEEYESYVQHIDAWRDWLANNTPGLQSTKADIDLYSKAYKYYISEATRLYVMESDDYTQAETDNDKNRMVGEAIQQALINEGLQDEQNALYTTLGTVARNALKQSGIPVDNQGNLVEMEGLPYTTDVKNELKKYYSWFMQSYMNANPEDIPFQSAEMKASLEKLGTTIKEFPATITKEAELPKPTQEQINADTSKVKQQLDVLLDKYRTSGNLTDAEMSQYQEWMTLLPPEDKPEYIQKYRSEADTTMQAAKEEQLTALISKKAQGLWTSEDQQAWDELYSSLKNTPAAQNLYAKEMETQLMKETATGAESQLNDLFSMAKLGNKPYDFDTQWQNLLTTPGVNRQDYESKLAQWEYELAHPQASGYKAVPQTGLAKKQRSLIG